MKKILLISEIFLHYRVSLYNEFNHLFKTKNIEFHVISNKKNSSSFDIEFHYYQTKYNYKKIIKLINEINPQYIIVFWHPYSFTTWKLLIRIRMKNNTALIYWGHGWSMK